MSRTLLKDAPRVPVQLHFCKRPSPPACTAPAGPLPAPRLPLPFVGLHLAPSCICVRGLEAPCNQHPDLLAGPPSWPAPFHHRMPHKRG